MRQLFLTTFFSFLALVAFGQHSKKIDDLKNRLLNEKKELIKIDLLIELAEFEDDDYDIKNDIDHVNELIKLSEKNNVPKGLIAGYKALSTAFVFDDFEKSIDFILKAKKISESIDDKKNQLKCIIQAGYIYADWSKYDKAFTILNEGADLVKINPNIEDKCKLYVCLGYVYSYAENEEKSLDNYTKALNCSDSLLCTDCFVEMRSYEGLCWAFIDRKQYDNAEKYAKSALIIANRINSDFYRASFNRILGRVYSDTNKLDIAAEHFKRALKNYKKGKYPIMVFDQFNYLSFLYSKNNEYSISSKYADSAIVFAKKANVQSAINSAQMSKTEALLNLGDIVKGDALLKEVSMDTVNKENWLSYHKEDLLYLKILSSEKKQNYKEALLYTNALHDYKDSLNNVRFDKKIVNSESKLETEFKEKENLQLKAKNAEQALLTQKANNQKWLFALGLLAALISAFFIWRRYKSEAKAKQIISEQKDEIEKQKNLVENLQKELHHRLKNNLSFIDLFINLAKGRFTDKAYQTKLNELQNRMRSMFEVHKQLFKKDDVTSVKAKTYIDALVQNVKESYAKDNISVVNTTNSNESILANTSFPVGLIVNEFITNSYKYAFDENDNGLINIALTSDEKQYQLSLKDNGKGLPKEFNINDLDSFGLETIQLLTKEYGGTFNIDGTSGVSMNIILPKNAA